MRKFRKLAVKSNWIRSIDRVEIQRGSKSKMKYDLENPNG